MRFQEIQIQSPCSEKISGMRPCQGGLYCDVCEKTVLDLRKKKAEDISAFAASKDEACVIVHVRHTTENSGYTLINSMERFLLRRKLRFISFILVGFLLFLNSCHNRKPKHKTGGKGSDTLFKTPDNSLK